MHFIKSILILSLIFLFCSFSTCAFSEDVQKTQGEFAVQLCKALGIDASAGDYIKQLEEKGIIPEGGWNTNKPINNTEMASLLAKALGFEKEIDKKVEQKMDEAYRNKATLIRFEGTVTVKIGEKGDWNPAQEGMKLTQSDSIKTGPSSWAELRVGMVGGLRIKENSLIILSELSSTPAGSENISIFMNTGEMLVDVRGLASGSDFRVQTPTTLAAVRGTIYNVKVEESTTNITEAK